MQSKSDLGQLVPRGGGDPIVLPKSSLIIGRRESCDIVLEYPNISSQHCQLEMKDGYWQVRDLRSRNGIKVNGERVDSRYLMPGDIIAIAKHHFSIEYQPSSSAPPPVKRWALLDEPARKSRSRIEPRIAAEGFPPAAISGPEWRRSRAQVLRR